MDEHRSYYALRRNEGTSAVEWWRAASTRRDLPPELAPLAAGRTRVELDRGAAVDALNWVDADTSCSPEALPVVTYPGDPRPGH